MLGGVGKADVLCAPPVEVTRNQALHPGRHKVRGVRSHFLHKPGRGIRKILPLPVPVLSRSVGRPAVPAAQKANVFHAVLGVRHVVPSFQISTICRADRWNAVAYRQSCSYFRNS